MFLLQSLMLQFRHLENFYGKRHKAIFVSIDSEANFHYNRFSIFNARKPTRNGPPANPDDRVAVAWRKIAQG